MSTFDNLNRPPATSGGPSASDGFGAVNPRNPYAERLPDNPDPEVEHTLNRLRHANDVRADDAAVFGLDPATMPHSVADVPVPDDLAPYYVPTTERQRVGWYTPPMDSFDPDVRAANVTERAYRAAVWLWQRDESAEWARRRDEAMAEVAARPQNVSDPLNTPAVLIRNVGHRFDAIRTRQVLDRAQNLSDDDRALWDHLAVSLPAARAAKDAADEMERRREVARKRTTCDVCGERRGRGVRAYRRDDYSGRVVEVERPGATWTGLVMCLDCATLHNDLAVSLVTSDGRDRTDVVRAWMNGKPDTAAPAVTGGRVDVDAARAALDALGAEARRAADATA